MEHDASRPARILVLYYSKSGHTKMMAELVSEGAASLPDTEVRLKTVNEAAAEDLVWCDGVAAGSPTHMGTIAWEMKRWWDETAQPLWFEVEGKLGCAFTSSGGLAGGGELTCLALQIVLMNYGLLVFGVPDYVARARPSITERCARGGLAMMLNVKPAAAWDGGSLSGCRRSFAIAPNMTHAKPLTKGCFEDLTGEIVLEEESPTGGLQAQRTSV